MFSPFKADMRMHARALAVFTASAAFLLSSFVASAQSMKIQEVVSSKGITAWLVEDHTLPLISMQFAFRGGSVQDPSGKAGVAYFVSGMLDEGAGDIRSAEFQEKLQDLAIKLSFESERDVFTGGIKTLTKNKDEAFDLLRLALNQPRMDQDAVERIREQIASIIRMDNEDPEDIAADSWFAHVFAGHPYGSPTKGTLDTLAKISADDLKNFVKTQFARDNLHVGVVGDITPDELAKTLDKAFGDLPEKADLKPVSTPDWTMEPRNVFIEKATPQTVVSFGLPGPKRKDDDFIPAYVLNYIIGGGGFSSKLMEEVREKRGLAYSVYTYLSPLDYAGICFGGVATKNEAVAESIAVIKDVLKQIATEGPSEEDLENAKRYLTGSYALRFSSSARIAQILLWVQIEELGIDYIDKRNSLIEAVTMADIKRVSGYMDPDRMVMTIVGQPEGLAPGPDESAIEAAPTRG